MMGFKFAAIFNAQLESCAYLKRKFLEDWVFFFVVFFCLHQQIFSLSGHMHPLSLQFTVGELGAVCLMRLASKSSSSE